MTSALVSQATAERWTARQTLAWVTIATVALALVAVINGYPFVFPDSGTYIRHAIKLEGALDRPPFYSLFILPLHMTLSLWPIPFAQNGITCYIIFRSFSVAFPQLSPPRLMIAVALAGGLTSLPWFSNQIMPDIFTPLILLLVFLLCLGRDRLTRTELIVMPLMLLIMITFHQANTAFAVLLLGAALLLAWQRGMGRRALAWSALLVVVPVALAILGQALYGYAVIRRFTPSPAGPFFALARLLDDGPGRRYLAQACPDAGYTLCRYQNAIHGDNNTFLWSANSPLHALISEKGEAGALNEASAIVAGTLRAFPSDMLLQAAQNTVRQLVSNETFISECPCLGNKIDRVIAEIFPSEHTAYITSMQNQGKIPWPIISILDSIVLWSSVFFLTVLTIFQHRLIAANAGRLLMLIAWGCVANAALMGALSGVTDRYESRIIWLVPLFAITVLLARRDTPLVPGWLPRLLFEKN